MTTPREEVIRELMQAANAGMIEAAEGSTASEVYSAYLTMAKCALQTARESGADMSILRDAVGLLMLECVDDKDMGRGSGRAN